jgi:hypothetical protein
MTGKKYEYGGISQGDGELVVLVKEEDEKPIRRHMQQKDITEKREEHTKILEELLKANIERKYNIGSVKDHAEMIIALIEKIESRLTVE